MSGNITELLNGVREGRPGAREQLLQETYDELRARARRQMHRERAGHTLQPTALVHEAFAKVFREESALPEFQNSDHFFGILANAMRQVLIDHAKGVNAAKRGGGQQERVRLDAEDQLIDAPERLDVDGLKAAISELAHLSPAALEIVQLRLIGNRTLAQIAADLDTSKSSIEQHWRFARVWLRERLAVAAS